MTNPSSERDVSDDRIKYLLDVISPFVVTVDDIHERGDEEVAAVVNAYLIRMRSAERVGPEDIASIRGTNDRLMPEYRAYGMAYNACARISKNFRDVAQSFRDKVGREGRSYFTGGCGNGRFRGIDRVESFIEDAEQAVDRLKRIKRFMEAHASIVLNHIAIRMRRGRRRRELALATEALYASAERIEPGFMGRAESPEPVVAQGADRLGI